MLKHITLYLGKQKRKLYINIIVALNWASLVTQLVKNPPAMRET